MSKIWTAPVRQLLYEQLVKHFGPHNKWERETLPGRGKDRAYERFLEHFAKVVGANSGEAVKHQIAYALPVKGKAHWKAGLVQNAILNLAAAYNAGFIRDADLPELHATGKKRVSKKEQRRQRAAAELPGAWRQQ